jgi:hypothetical protein
MRSFSNLSKPRIPRKWKPVLRPEYAQLLREAGMAFRKRREALRSILAGSTCIRPGSVYDAISIRIAEDLGFEVGMFGGSVASLAVLGDPDIALITLTELAEQMRRMSRAAALPVLVDADHGYCNALNVRRTIQAGLWAGENAAYFAGGRRRQDESRAGRARRSIAGDHGAHRCCVGLRS